MMRKVAFKTLGCRLNQFETDALVTDFYKSKYELVDFSNDADVYIINTCTVTNQSDRKSKYFINQIRKKNNNPVIVVTGCMVNSQKEKFEKMNDITYVIENNRKSDILSLVNGHFNGEIIHPDDLKQNLFDFSVTEKSFHTRSMIKIQDGCNNFCSFCIVPRVRGRAVSRPVNDILNNIRQVIGLGYKEVVLTGVNISRYHFEGSVFEDLVEKVLKIEGDFRLRISSIEPEGFGEKFIDLFSHPKLCPHLHLCLQSGSDKILSLMKRQYTIKDYLKIIDSFKSRFPDFNFTTDVIVGFPGESEEDFSETCKVINRVGFSHIHTFKYSKRSNTPAEKMDGQIHEKVKTERSKIIRDLSDKNKQIYRKQFIGKIQTVLTEKNKNGIYSGYGEHYIPVEIKDTYVKKNQFYKVSLHSMSDKGNYILKGDVIL